MITWIDHERALFIGDRAWVMGLAKDGECEGEVQEPIGCDECTEEQTGRLISNDRREEGCEETDESFCGVVEEDEDFGVDIEEVFVLVLGLCNLFHDFDCLDECEAEGGVGGCS